MSPRVRYLLLVIAAAALAFGLTHVLLRPVRHAELDEMAWMQNEFHLTPPQVAAIEQLNADYHPICLEHCKRITAARKALATASPEAEPAAQAELTRLEAVCHDATLAHVQRVAGAMSPDQGARFLTLVAPKVSGQQHHAPLGLD